MKIRTAGEADAAVVACIIRRSFRKQAQLLGIRESEWPAYVAFETASRVRSRMELGCQVALASVSGAVVGTVSFRGWDERPEGEVARLAVLPSSRGKGYGAGMMAYAEGRLIASAVRIAEVSIVADFTRLRSYYEALGYSAIARRRVPSLPFDVLYMRKALAGSGSVPCTSSCQG